MHVNSAVRQKRSGETLQVLQVENVRAARRVEEAAARTERELAR